MPSCWDVIVDKATWFADVNGTQPYPFVLWRRQPGTSGKATVWLDTELPKFYEQWSAVQGARVLATTRFPADAALRYASERDFDEWSDRLEVMTPR